MQSEKELLEQLVKECSSYTEILRRLGKSNSGPAIKVLKEKLDTYGIIHHFVYEKRSTKKIPLEEILLNNRPYKSCALKKRLVEEEIKENRCELCGQLPFHNGKELVLQLDHINGDHNDNRLENLRILCPNCHSQTETYSARKNKKETNTCLDCGASIGPNSPYCVKCAPKHRHDLKNIKPSKEILLENIKTMSFREVGENYKVPEYTIKTWCKEYELPNNKSDLKKYLLNNNSSLVSAGTMEA